MNRFSCTSWIIVLALGTLTLTGCGSGGTGVVEGKVTVNGQPIKGLEVLFADAAGEVGSVVGYTRKDGSYRLIRGRGEPGIPVGEYRVTISGRADDSGPAKVRLGPNYSDMSQTELSATVESGENEIDFELMP